MNAATKNWVSEVSADYDQEKGHMPADMTKGKHIYLTFWAQYITGPGFEKPGSCGDFGPQYHHWNNKAGLNVNVPCICGDIKIQRLEGYQN